MNRSFRLSILLLLAALSASGCHFFKKNKNPKPKENPAIATDTEEAFKVRWVDRRVAELTAKGVNAVTARQQADAEFNEHFGYTHAATK